jgi:hypothetical protein
MGTRADFYMGRGPDAEWLGSIAWDGNPGGLTGDDVATVEPGENELLTTRSAVRYRELVQEFLLNRDDATFPEQGWPWPWVDSGTTDYAYSFALRKVWGCSFGGPWWPAVEESDDDQAGQKAVFPDMATRRDVAWGKRSGVMIVRPRSPLDDHRKRPRRPR